MNDLEIKNLINSAVDRELADHRVAPPWQPTDAPHRSGHPVTTWMLPVLAASVAALLVAVTVLAIGHGRSAQHAPPAHSASPAPTPSRSLDPDQEAAEQAYIDAVVGAREATETAGVSVGPVSSEDAARYQDSALWTVPDAGPETPQPGRSYPIIIRYVVGPHTQPNGDQVSVLSGELRNVADGSCPPPFLVRPAHTYLITCQASFLPGSTGKAAFIDRNRTGTRGYGFDLGNPSSAATTTLSPERQQAARDYDTAVAAAPEAGTVAGVTDRLTTAEEAQRSGESVGLLDGPVSAPEKGRSYPVTLSYIPPADGPAVSVLTIRFEDVVRSRCPGPFRIRPGHAYRISCQATFRPGTAGLAYYDLRGPQGVTTAGHNISFE